MRRCRSILVPVAVAVAVAACRARPTAEDAWQSAIAAARARRTAELTAPEGWLSLVARHLLAPGPNVVGSDPTAAISLEAPGIPPRACSFDLREDGTVALRVEPGAPVLVNGLAAKDGPLVPEGQGSPDVVSVGRVQLTLFLKDGRNLVRARDPQNRRRLDFPGIAYFPLQPAWRVEAAWEAYPSPREVELPSSRGPAQKAPAPGVARFRASGLDLSLEPIIDDPADGTLFFVFSDATGDVETYGGGRFLRVPRPKDGESRVVLDFNLAENPPCAFTPYASCPLAVPRNTLPVRVEAGEKAPKGH